MAETVEITDSTVTIRFTREELVGLSNVINHAIGGGFNIDKRDCSTIVGLEWTDLHQLWSAILEPLDLNKGIN